MKPCCICTALGVAIGMVGACYLMVTSQKFKQFVKDSKSSIEKTVQDMKKPTEE